MTAQLYAQSFEYIYSTSDDEVISDAVEDATGNFYLVGTKGISATGYYSGLIIKLNSSGDTVNTLIFPPSGDYINLISITKLSDSLFIAFGTKQISSTNDAQILYIKFDNNLNILQEKTFGHPFYTDQVHKAKINLQNEFMIVGYAIGFPDLQIFFYRATLDGDSLESFYLGDSFHNEFGWDVLQLPDTSGYLIFSIGWASMSPFVHNEILEINNSGVLDTVVIIEDSHIIVSARWISDSTFVTASSGYNPNGPDFSFDLFPHKYDLNFNLLADTLMGPTDTTEIEAPNAIDFIDTNKIFIGGTINYQSNYWGVDPAYFYLIKFDSNIIPQWEKVISHNDDYLNLYKVLATNDGGILLAGTRYNDLTSGLYERDIYVIKIDSLGNFVTGINEQPGLQVHEVIVYPNPVQDAINIKSTINFSASQFILYDVAGRQVIKKDFNKSASFPVKQINAGIYFYQIKSKEGKIEYGKLIKE